MQKDHHSKELLSIHQSWIFRDLSHEIFNKVNDDENFKKLLSNKWYLIIIQAQWDCLLCKSSKGLRGQERVLLKIRDFQPSIFPHHMSPKHIPPIFYDQTQLRWQFWLLFLQTMNVFLQMQRHKPRPKCQIVSFLLVCLSTVKKLISRNWRTTSFVRDSLRLSCTFSTVKEPFWTYCYHHYRCGCFCWFPS